MLMAYMVRFMAAGFGAVDSAMQGISPSLDEAAALMGVKGRRLILTIHLPLLRKGLLTALILLMVDVVKEMPITLMTRPFGWDTLAVKIYELTSEGEWERAALPGLYLVMASIIPVILLIRQSEK
jgi:iron(III) transport system permease protein